MLGNLRISSKLMIMVVLSVLGIGAMAAVGLSVLKANLLEDRKAKLLDGVETARDREATKKRGRSEADMLTRSKDLLRKLRFGKDDYLYAIDMTGTVMVH